MTEPHATGWDNDDIGAAFSSSGLGGQLTPHSTWRADPRCGVDATMTGPFVGTPELGGYPMQRVDERGAR